MRQEGSKGLQSSPILSDESLETLRSFKEDSDMVIWSQQWECDCVEEEPCGDSGLGWQQVGPGAEDRHTDCTGSG